MPTRHLSNLQIISGVSFIFFSCYSLELSYKLFFSPDFSSLGFEVFIDNPLESKTLIFLGHGMVPVPFVLSPEGAQGGNGAGFWVGQCIHIECLLDVIHLK